MKRRIAALHKKYSQMTAVQQKFIRYVVIIKVAVLILGSALLALAWYLLFGK